MSYIKNNLSKDEDILIYEKVSPMAYRPFLIIMGIATSIFGLLTFMPDFSVIPFVICAAIMIGNYLNCKCIEMAITNKRIIIKSGIFSTKTDELKLEKCESVNIKQGIFGSIFNIGTITFSGTGTTKLDWTKIGSPKQIKNKIEDIFDSYKK